MKIHVTTTKIMKFPKCITNEQRVKMCNMFSIEPGGCYGQECELCPFHSMDSLNMFVESVNKDEDDDNK